MFDTTLYFTALSYMLIFGLLGWVLSVIKRNVTIVDSMWSLFFVIATFNYYLHSPQTSDSISRHSLVLILVVVWACRLFAYLSYRNRGGHEDRRYETIRNNNEPNFWLKSIYIVFGLQAVLAWIVSLPLLPAMLSTSPLGMLDLVAFLIWCLGFIWETLADWQLARFKSNPNNLGQVLDQGVWRYSRHPNYFGEACIWWAYGLFGVASGNYWTLLGPTLMHLLLLKVSGVALLEKDIAERRPRYAQYIAETNAFFPGPKKNKGAM